MTWFEASQDHIRRIEREHMHDGMTVRERERILTDHYPFSWRGGSAYKSWLRARKQYLDRHRVHPPTPLEAAIYRQARAEKRGRKGNAQLRNSGAVAGTGGAGDGSGDV